MRSWWLVALVTAVATVCEPTTAASTVRRCDTHWTRSDDNCYFVIDEAKGDFARKLDWSSAKSECESLGSHLADASNPKVAQFAQKLSSSRNNEKLWVTHSNNCAAATATAASPSVTDCHQSLSALCVKPLSNCALGWYEFNNRCFQMKPDSLSWDEAKSTCNQMGADLIQVKDAETQKFMNRYLASFVKQKITHIWIGLYQTKIGDTQPLQWTSGGNVDDFHQNWNIDEPQLSSSSRNAVRMITADAEGRWEIGRPTDSRGFVCEIPAGTEPILPTEDYRYSCPEPWSLFRSNCYGFFTSTKSWDAARARCKSESADLIDIRDANEQEFVQRHLNRNHMWIGLHSREKWGEWYWNDDSTQASYYNWADGEPNNYENDEYCVQLWRDGDGRWNDENCRANAFYGCKRPADINGSPPTTTPRITTTVSPICGAGWVKDPFSDNCYKIVQEPMNWPNARLFCQASGGDLASITSINEKTLITGQIQQLTQAGSSVLGYWIGFNDLAEKNRWVWSDSSPVAFVNWDYEEPNDFDGNEDCAQLFPKSLFWNDSPCSSLFGSICKKRGNVPPTTKPPPTTIAVPPGSNRGCRNGYTGYNNMCYRHYFDKVQWQEARQKCRDDGGDLVSYENALEHEFVSEMVQSQGGYRFWIGLHDTTAAIRTMFFQWSDGSPVTFTKWNVGEPNDFSNEENCVEQYDVAYQGQWNDIECTLPHAFVCKRREELVTETVPTTAPERCPADYQDLYAGFCYKYVVGDEQLTWTQAQSKCRSVPGGNLVAITSSNVQGHINLKLFELKAESPFWTGLSARGQGSFFWIGCCLLGSRSYTNWQSGANTRLQYAYLNPSGISMGTWNMKSGTDTLTNYICRTRRAGVTTPPPPPTTYDPRQCAAGWVEADDTCYLPVYQLSNLRRLSWEEARHQCVLQGGDLASIHSPNATAVLRGVIRATSVPYWIGLNSRADSKQYVWSDGSSLNHFEWKNNEPNNFNGRHNCVQLDARDMKWYVASCAGANNWICETPKGINPGNVTTPTPTTEPELPGCPRFYYRFRDSCYRAVSTFLDWFASRDYCRRFDADIVSISDQEEQDFVLRLVNRVTKTRSMWIGLNEFGQNDGFRWADGTPVTYVNWNKGEPNNAGGAEHCVTLYAFNGLWNDDQCGTRTSVVCKLNNSTVNSTLAPQTPMPGECPTGFYSVGDKCLRLFGKKSDQVTWSEAFDRCNRLSGVNRSYLASVANEFEQAYLISLAKDSEIDLWIGLHSRTSIPRRYVWIDNSRVSYTNWARGNPSGSISNPSNCVTMLTEKYRAGKWSDILCNQTRGYVCMTYKQSSIITTWPGPVPTRILCQQGWMQYGDACFQLNPASVSWQTAQRNCANAGANLASVHDVWEQSYLHSLTQSLDSDGTWIGLNDQQNSSKYLWSDGWPVLYSYWDRNYPNTELDQRCVSMNRNGRWRNTGCSSLLPYLCRKSFGQAPSTAPSVQGRCPTAEFVQFGSFCYFFSDVTRQNQLVTFANAQLACKLWGGDITSVTFQGEKDFLVREVERRTQGLRYLSNFWLGMTRQFGGGFQWLDGSAVSFVFWADGEPSDVDGSQNENCVEMFLNDYRWNDISCNTQNGYVCKVKVQPGTGYTQPQTTATAPSSTQQQRTTDNNGQNTRQTQYTARSTASRADFSTRPPIVDRIVPDLRNNLLIGFGVAVILLALVAMVVVAFVVKGRQQKSVNESGFSNANWSRDSGNVQLSTEEVAAVTVSSGVDVGGADGEAIENKGFASAEA